MVDTAASLELQLASLGLPLSTTSLVQNLEGFISHIETFETTTDQFEGLHWADTAGIAYLHQYQQQDPISIHSLAFSDPSFVPV